MDFAAGGVEFLGDLSAGLTGADYQHGAFRQLLRIAVIVRVELCHVGGEPGGQRGDLGDLVRAGREDHVLGPQVPERCLKIEGAVRRSG